MVDLNKCKIGDTLVSCHGLKLLYHKVDDNNAPFRHLVVYPDGAGGSRADDGRVFINRPLPEDHNIVKVIPMDRSEKNDVTIIDVMDLEEDAAEFTKKWAIKFANGTVMLFDTEDEAREAQRIHRETIGLIDTIKIDHEYTSWEPFNK